MMNVREAALEPLDLVKELKLRRWARENFVLPEDRDRSWHPVILEEMQAKQAEMQAQEPRETFAASYVPLVPSQSAFHLVHDAHMMSPRVSVSKTPDVEEVFFHG